MSLFDLIAVLLTLAAAFAYLNARLLRLPITIGVMTLSLAVSLALIGLQSLGFATLTTWAESTVATIDFDRAVLDALLSIILFAGALNVDLGHLSQHRGLIGLLATLGVVVSTALVGGAIYGVSIALDLPLSLLHCLLFGAIIAPTDPIAVLGIVRQLGVPANIETQITSESLFNDGFAVVVFLGLLGLATESSSGVDGMALLFVKEVFGGLGLGFVLGGLGYLMLRTLDDHIVEVLVTLALVIGGYALALSLHFSGPLAVVVAGLLIGNHGRRLAMSPHTREHLDGFWSIADEILNILLFLLVGLEVLVIRFELEALVAGAIAIPVMLVARFLVVGGIVQLLSPWREFTSGVSRLLTWGGLRGGISVALALSLPNSAERELIVAMTYIVVVFSILVQGLTVAPLVRRVIR